MKRELHLKVTDVQIMSRLTTISAEIVLSEKVRRYYKLPSHIYLVSKDIPENGAGQGFYTLFYMDHKPVTNKKEKEIILNLIKDKL